MGTSGNHRKEARRTDLPPATLELDGGSAQAVPACKACGDTTRPRQGPAFVLNTTSRVQEMPTNRLLLVVLLASSVNTASGYQRQHTPSVPEVTMVGFL